MSNRVLIASTNVHKLTEFRRILAPAGIAVVAPFDLGISLNVAETGTTFADNARVKAEAYLQVSDLVTVADDSGLQVDALGGEPGIYSARYGGAEASDADRVRLVLDKIQQVPAQLRTARFVAAIAVASPEHETAVVEAGVEGFLTREPRGQGGFGYDPIFFYPPCGCTFAELQPAVKDAVSHRGKALAAAAMLIRQRVTR